jgi:hypothetical protein
MSTTLKIKRSVTSGNTPSNLSLGELAVNIPDKKIWIGDATEQPILISQFGTGGAGGETYYEGLGININTNNVISIDPGKGISVDTNNGINLDLSVGLTTVDPIVTTLDKYDKVPFLEYSDGQTKLISASKFLQVGLSTALSGEAYNPANPSTDERTTVAIQDQNPNAFIIKTLQNAGGYPSKNNIFKIDTEASTARITLAGTSISIEPDTELNIGKISTPVNVVSQEVNFLNLTTMSLGGGNISDVNQISPSGQNVYIQGNLIVSGFIETDVGLRGDTDAAEEYLGIGMVLDGGEY